jgi:hypothetical protein
MGSILVDTGSRRRTVGFGFGFGGSGVNDGVVKFNVGCVVDGVDINFVLKSESFNRTGCRSILANDSEKSGSCFIFTQSSGICLIRSASFSNDWHLERISGLWALVAIFKARMHSSAASMANASASSLLGALLIRASML